MPRFVLDTDTFSLFLKGHPQVTANVLGRPLPETGTTIITVEEELSGWYTTLRKAKSSVTLATGYRRMTETVESLALLKLLTFTEAAIARFAILRKQPANRSQRFANRRDCDRKQCDAGDSQSHRLSVHRRADNRGLVLWMIERSLSAFLLAD